MQPSSRLRGNASAFHPTLRGDAPVFHPYAPRQRPRRHHQPTIVATPAFNPPAPQRRHFHPRRRLPEPAPQPQCALLALPAELRNKIYSLSVLSPDPIIAVTRVPGHYYPNKKWSSTVPTLAQTCRQIRRECLGMYYAENVFVFDTDADDYMEDAIANGWVKSLARSGMERHVKRVGSVWKSLEVQEEKVVMVEMAIIATLGEDDTLEEKMEKKRLAALLEEGEVLETTPKVVFELRSPHPIYAICDHVLASCAEAFEKRRKGKSVRGYGALIDMVLTVANFLRPLEVCIYPKECRACESKGQG